MTKKKAAKRFKELAEKAGPLSTSMLATPYDPIRKDRVRYFRDIGLLMRDDLYFDLFACSQYLEWLSQEDCEYNDA